MEREAPSDLPDLDLIFLPEQAGTASVGADYQRDMGSRSCSPGEISAEFRLAGIVDR
jgi:hypothetical protein